MSPTFETSLALLKFKISVCVICYECLIYFGMSNNTESITRNPLKSLVSASLGDTFDGHEFVENYSKEHRVYL